MWTTPQDVINAWIGEDAPDDLGKIEVWIGRAERLIRSTIPGIEARITGGLEPDLLDNIVGVVCSMVERKFRNPDGTRQVASTTGPFSEQRTFGGNDPGELALLDSEVALLTGVKGGMQAYTVDMIPSTSPYSPNYVGAVFPWGV